MSGLNKVMLIGRVGKDPEIRYMNNGQPVANLSLATSEKYKNKQGEWVEKTEWHKVVCFDKLAELVQQYIFKGNQVYFEGKIQTRQWEDKDGAKRYSTEIVASQMVFLDNKNSGESRPEKPESKPLSTRPKQQDIVQPDFEKSHPSDDDYPF